MNEPSQLPVYILAMKIAISTTGLSMLIIVLRDHLKKRKE